MLAGGGGDSHWGWGPLRAIPATQQISREAKMIRRVNSGKHQGLITKNLNFTLILCILYLFWEGLSACNCLCLGSTWEDMETLCTPCCSFYRNMKTFWIDFPYILMDLKFVSTDLCSTVVRPGLYLTCLDLLDVHLRHQSNTQLNHPWVRFPSWM